MKEFLITLLASSVVSAIISGIVTYMNNERNLKLKYVTEDRQKWRERMKKLFVQFIHPTNDQPRELTYTEIKFNLNPKDDYDNGLLKIMEEIMADPQNKSLVKELELKVQVLFKSEWEKAKIEANMKSDNNITSIDPQKLYEEIKTRDLMR